MTPLPLPAPTRAARLRRALTALLTGLALSVTAAVLSPAASARTADIVRVSKDLAYAPAQPAGSQGHLLDLYVPASPAPVPLVIFTSGSGWMADSGRRGADTVAAQLNSHGYAVAGVAVRSSGQARFPAQLYDIKAAVRWLRANAGTYHLDPRRIAIMGDSSGGWVTTMAAVTGDIPWLEGDVGVRGPSSAVQAAIPFYAPTDFLAMDAHMPDNCAVFNAAFGLTDCHSDPRSPESRLLGCAITACPGRVAAASPLSYIGGRPAPPFLLLHGEPDAFVPYHQSRLLFDALAAAGGAVRLISFPGAGHGTAFRMLTDDATRAGAREESAGNGHSTPARPVTPTWETITAFLDRRLGHHSSSAAGPVRRQVVSPEVSRNTVSVV